MPFFVASVESSFNPQFARYTQYLCNTKFELRSNLPPVGLT